MFADHKLCHEFLQQEDICRKFTFKAKLYRKSMAVAVKKKCEKKCSSLILKPQPAARFCTIVHISIFQLHLHSFKSRIWQLNALHWNNYLVVKQKSKHKLSRSVRREFTNWIFFFFNRCKFPLSERIWMRRITVREINFYLEWHSLIKYYN